MGLQRPSNPPLESPPAPPRSDRPPLPISPPAAGRAMSLRSWPLEAVAGGEILSSAETRLVERTRKEKARTRRGAVGTEPQVAGGGTSPGTLPPGCGRGARSLIPERDLRSAPSRLPAVAVLARPAAGTAAASVCPSQARGCQCGGRSGLLLARRQHHHSPECGGSQAWHQSLQSSLLQPCALSPFLDFENFRRKVWLDLVTTLP